MNLLSRRQRSRHRRRCRCRVALPVGLRAAKASAARQKLPLAIWRRCSRGWSTPRSSRACAGHGGGYELARDCWRITVGEIVRTAMSCKHLRIPKISARTLSCSSRDRSGRAQGGETFLANLDAITVEQMRETAEKSHVLDDEKVSGEFAI